MPRPTEYENLIKTRAFDAVAPTPGAIAGFLHNAEDYKTTADELDPARHLQYLPWPTKATSRSYRLFWSSTRCGPKMPAVTWLSSAFPPRWA